MGGRLSGKRAIPYVFWGLTCLAIVIWSLVPGYVVGWDLNVYKNAILALRAGHDPYADGIAVQRLFHAEIAHHVNEPTPFTYVYSPLTLPLLRLIGAIPFLVSAPVYWVVYVLAAIATIWVGMQFVEEREKRVMALLAPAAIFFPGLIQNDVLFAGNVACILYAAVFLAAWRGWQRGDWKWFYVAVLATSCCKAPMLSLLAIAVLSARKQWVPVLVTGAAGIALFAMQPLVWPTAFHNYLEAVELQFSFNHDFSSSPAGLMANSLYNVIPYTITSAVFYLMYAVPIFLVLLHLSRKFMAGAFSLKQWVSPMLVGVVLLNPRIMEYDVAPLTISMALVVWRFSSRRRTMAMSIVLASIFFAGINISGAFFWRPTECFALIAVFVAGVWELFDLVKHGVPAADEVAEAAATREALAVR